MQHDLQNTFTKLGGEFLSPLNVISRKQLACRAYLLDWDGVFNGGHKANTSAGSGFSEPDAMGINMLRFSVWLRNSRMPLTAIITGELNPGAFSLAVRDHYDFVFFKVNHKVLALDWLNRERGVGDHHTAFIMDDVLDLGVASRVNLRVLINREASPLFKEMIRKKEHADYISANTGETHAVREVSELLIGLNGNYTETIDRRVKYIGEYSKFLSERNGLQTRFISGANGLMEELSAQQVQDIISQS